MELYIIISMMIDTTTLLMATELLRTLTFYKDVFLKNIAKNLSFLKTLAVFISEIIEEGADFFTFLLVVFVNLIKLHDRYFLVVT